MTRPTTPIQQADRLAHLRKRVLLVLHAVKGLHGEAVTADDVDALTGQLWDVIDDMKALAEVICPGSTENPNG